MQPNEFPEGGMTGVRAIDFQAYPSITDAKGLRVWPWSDPQSRHGYSPTYQVSTPTSGGTFTNPKTPKRTGYLSHDAVCGSHCDGYRFSFGNRTRLLGRGLASQELPLSRWG